MPKTAPPAKVAQLLTYGATVLLVDGNYDAAFDLCLAASREFGWYCRNTGYNPYTVEGKKTVAFEICEQLGAATGRAPYVAPDVIVVSVGDGNIITGVHRGLQDLLALGWIDRLPRLVAVQSSGSAAVYNAWAAGHDTITPVPAHTVADSIAADMPRDGLRALRAIRETGAVKGLAHITGGGFTDNIPRVLPKHLGVGIDLARLPVLPVFKWLAEQGGIAELELLRTFNCGIGMIAIVRSDAVEKAIEVFSDSGETVALLGEVIEAKGEHRVVYNGHLDLAL